MNRCLVLAVDEGREQTRAIHARQRAKRTLAGLAAKTKKKISLPCTGTRSGFCSRWPWSIPLPTS